MAREGLDMAQLPPNGSPRVARAAGAVLRLDDVGRAAARRQIAKGANGTRLMPTPDGLFEAWNTRPRVRS